MDRVKDFLRIFASRTVLVIILTFIVNGISSVRELIPVSVLPIVDAVLGLLAIYFRVKPRANF